MFLEYMFLECASKLITKSNRATYILIYVKTQAN